MTMEMLRDLPRELVEDEILIRVPATYLKGLGSTCKRWNRMFNGDGRFARKHSDKAAKQFMVLLLRKDLRISQAIVDLDGKVPSLEVKTEVSLVDPTPKCPAAAQFEAVRVFHCDGLLLCTSFDESRFVVWNPFTGETRWFVPSYRAIGDRQFALGYYYKEGNTKSYKVLSFYQWRKDFEIYEFGSDSWRVVDDVMAPGWKLGGNCTFNVSLKGSTYGFAQDETKPQSRPIVSLVRFDFSTEKWVPVPLPYQRNHFRVTGLSVVKDEKLSVLLQPEIASKTEIWVTNKIDTSQVASWSKVLAFDMRPDFDLFGQARFLLDDEKKVAMLALNWLDFEDDLTKSRDMIYIAGEDNEATQVDLGPSIEDESRADILHYFPSLVQIERAGGKRKRADM